MARMRNAITGHGSTPIFISHASEDADLASSLQSLIEAALRKRSTEELVFRSTDVAAIEGGADWYDTIITALRQSKVCLSLLTPTSIHKPWVIYESGGAYAIYRDKAAKRLIAVCAGGITPGLVPSPLKRLQVRQLYDPGELEQLLKELAALLRRRLRLSNSRIKRVANRGRDINGGWASVSPARLASRVELSPYRVDRALAVAQKYVFMAGQNLYSIASSEANQNAILNFLREDKDRRVDVLICDLQRKECVKAWAWINPEQAATGYTYKDHLRTATREFLRLLRQARRERLLGLRIKVLPLIPIGVTVIDPDSKSGIMTFQPVINHGPKSGERPQFLVSKADNREVFSYYWLNLTTAFKFSDNLR